LNRKTFRGAWQNLLRLRENFQEVGRRGSMTGSSLFNLGVSVWFPKQAGGGSPKTCRGEGVDITEPVPPEDQMGVGVIPKK